jgi:hypothetical protein
MIEVPRPGEAILVVPQTFYALFRDLQGQPATAADPHTLPLPNLTTTPTRWTTFSEMPRLGEGFLIVRDGVFVRSIDHFDSSG